MDAPPNVKAGTMRRRDFITVVGGTVAAWPLLARAQQKTMVVIGLLSPQSPGPAMDSRIGAFVKGLAEFHYVVGENVRIEYRWAEGRYERLRSLADDLVSQRVDIIVAPTHDAALAAKAATTMIPIIFNSGGDPVGSGLVASMNRPGSNITGVSMFSYELGAKRLGLLHEMVPKIRTVGVLVNPTNASADLQRKELLKAANSVGLDVLIRNVSADRDLDAVFDDLVKEGAQALTTGADPFLASVRNRLIALACKHQLPAIWEWPDFVESGGLMSYGTSIVDTYRLVGAYAGRVLAGEKTAELPVLQPVKFDLAINTKTARALGIEIPASLIASADEVVE
jgi:putative ABC transport system substrate-binding protein